MRKRIFLCLLTLLSFSIACSRKPSDQTIAQDIEKKIAVDPDTNHVQVTVEAKDGLVHLKGTANSQAARDEVEKIANKEPGVVGVNNEISVVTEGGPAAAAAHSADQAVVEPAPAPPPKPIVVPAGTVLTIRTEQVLSSKNSQAGQTFLATLAQPVSVEGKPALTAGSAVSGTVVTAKSKGKVKGEGQLDLALTSISVGGHTYPIKTNLLSSTVKGKGKRTAATTGGGAAGGALIGGIAGGGKGAAIGAGVGAAAGFIGGAFTGNKQIEIPAESALSFTLAQPLTLEPGSND